MILLWREYKDYTGNSVLYLRKKMYWKALFKTWEKNEKNFNFFWGEIGI